MPIIPRRSLNIRVARHEYRRHNRDPGVRARRKRLERRYYFLKHLQFDELISPIEVLWVTFSARRYSTRGGDAERRSGRGLARLEERATNLLGAVRYGRAEEVRRFLTAGAPVDAADPLGMTALHWSVYSGRLAIAALLIDHGADVRARDASGETPLHCAAARRGADLAALLIRRGADVNAADVAGQTPLHYAAIWNGETETSALLIAQGAVVNVADKAGDTPLALAEDRLFDELAKLLRRHGGRTNQ